jgi:hypothetical protein
MTITPKKNHRPPVLARREPLQWVPMLTGYTGDPTNNNLARK